VREHNSGIYLHRKRHNIPLLISVCTYIAYISGSAVRHDRQTVTQIKKRTDRQKYKLSQRKT